MEVLRFIWFVERFLISLEIGRLLVLRGTYFAWRIWSELLLRKAKEASQNKDGHVKTNYQQKQFSSCHLVYYSHYFGLFYISSK